MLDRIKEVEREALLERALPALREVVASVLSAFESPVSLSVRYVPGEPIRVDAIQLQMDDQKEAMRSLESHPVPSSGRRKSAPKPKPRSPRKESQGFKVVFPDGDVILHKKEVDTFIHAIRRFGYETVHALGIDKGGVNLVSREKLPSRPGAVYQHEIEGWFIYTLLSNEAKKTLLSDIAKRLSLAIRVEHV